MELNICHLYPDLLNVYGDVGNILILKHRAEERGIKVNIINVSLNDELDYEDTMNTIKDVLYSLDLKYTAPFELKMNNFSLKEISILLEVSINSVSYRVNLVRDEIRTRILCE